MPAALPPHVRKEIIKSRENGETFRSIANRLQISYGAVRNIYHRYVQSGEIAPRYDACGPTQPKSPAEVVERAVAYKREHPTWGAGIIRTYLIKEFGRHQVPSQRSLQRWFRQAGVQKAKPTRVANMTVARGRQAHEVWAMDAKEKIKLADGSEVSWLTITDEGSGAIIASVLFPPRDMG